MKDSQFIINTSNDSILQTYRNAEGYFNTAILIINNSKYNFNEEEELSADDQAEKYTQKNIILTQLAFAYENYIKYLLLSNKLYMDPSIHKSQLWGSWIRKHGMNDLYRIASDSGINSINDFDNKLLKILTPFFGFNGIGFNRSLYVGDEDYHDINLAMDLDPNSQIRSSNMVDKDDVEQFLLENNDLFIKCRYSGENQTNFDFKKVFDFISGIRFFSNINYHNNNLIPSNIEFAYIKEKLLTDDIIKKVHKYRTDEEIKKILNLDICKKSSMLTIQLLSSNTYSIEQIKDLLNRDDLFNNPQFLLRFIFNYNYEEVIKLLDRGDSPILLLNSGFNDLISIFNIPVVGSYFKKHPYLFEFLITNEHSAYGLKANEWIDLLSIDEVQKHSEIIEPLCISLVSGIKMLSQFETEILGKKIENGRVDYLTVKNNILENIKYFSNNSKLMNYFANTLWMVPGELKKEAVIIETVESSLLDVDIKKYNEIARLLAHKNIYKYVNGKWTDQYYDEYIDGVDKGFYK